MSLSVGIGAFQKKFNGRMGRFKRGVLLKLFGAVIADTPVGNEDTWNIPDSAKAWLKKNGYMGGRLRGAWTFSVDSPSSSLPITTEDPTATVAAGVNSGVTEKDGSVFLTNNMPYARRIEYEGHSKVKAPQGMVRKNMARIAKLLAEEAAKQ